MWSRIKLLAFLSHLRTRVNVDMDLAIEGKTRVENISFKIKEYAVENKENSLSFFFPLYVL